MQSAILSAEAGLYDVYITGAATQSAAGNNIIASGASAAAVDTMAQGTAAMSYRSFACQIEGSAGIASGAVTFEGSNDNTNFFTLPVYDMAVITGTQIQAAITIAASTHRFFTGKCAFRYIRCRISTVFSGGTVQAFTRISAMDLVPQVMTVGQPTAANLLTTATIGSGTVTTVSTVSAARVVGNTGATMDAALGGAAPTNALWSTEAPSTAAGAACSASTTGNSLTVVNIKASAGNVYGVTVVNKTASVIYLQFYNTAGTPVLGTSVVGWIPVPASGTLIIPPGAMALQNFTTGIGIGASTTPTSSGTPGTAPDVTIWFK